MHIVLDVRILETSTGRYMQRLIEHINDKYCNDGHKYTAIMPNKYVKKWQHRLPNLSIVGSDAKWYTMSEQIQFRSLLASLKPDLVHFTMPQQPILWHGKSITTVHDMTLIRFDNIDSSDNKYVYKFKKSVFNILMQKIMRGSSAIITPTNFVRKDLGLVYGERFLPKIHVTYEAGEIPDEKPEPLTDFIGVDYICTVGNMFPYKNVERVVLAFEQAVKQFPKLHLLCAGKKDEFSDKLEALVLERGIPNVHFLGFITDGEKRWLLENAKAYVTASLSEGFCIPVLEAMYAGCPVISSNASCLPETGGKAALYFDPSSTDELTEKIFDIIRNEPLRQSLVKKGLVHVNNFSWEKMAEQTHAIYEQVLKP